MSDDKSRGTGKSGMSRRQFLTAAGVAGATGVLGHATLAAGDETGARAGTDGSAITGRYPRSVLPADASKTRREIQESVDQISIIDTHEHLSNEDAFLARPQGERDFSLFVSHYTKTDLVSAGMPGDELHAVRAADTPLKRKWRLLKPYWEKMRTTGYGWVKQLAIRGFYGLDDLSDDTYAELTKRTHAAHKPGFYKRILKDAAGIDRCVVDRGDENVDREFFVPALRVDHYICVGRKDHAQVFSKLSGKSLESVQTISDALQGMISIWKEKAVAAAKCAMAYQRTLEVENVSDQDAQRILDALLANDDRTEIKRLQDYIFKLVLRACADQKMPLQVHTGILVGNNNALERTDPIGLHDILAKYPQAKVDLFHAGYPWTSNMAAMGKVNTSVYADLCWAHAINPIASRNALDEWLDAMPASKILAFGGDYGFPEGTYGHSMIARTNVGHVLASRVESGRMSMAEAKRVAQMILRDNAVELFGLA